MLSVCITRWSTVMSLLLVMSTLPPFLLPTVKSPPLIQTHMSYLYRQFWCYREDNLRCRRDNCRLSHPMDSRGPVRDLNGIQVRVRQIPRWLCRGFLDGTCPFAIRMVQVTPQYSMGWCSAGFMHPSEFELARFDAYERMMDSVLENNRNPVIRLARPTPPVTPTGGILAAMGSPENGGSSPVVSPAQSPSARVRRSPHGSPAPLAQHTGCNADITGILGCGLIMLAILLFVIVWATGRH